MGYEISRTLLGVDTDSAFVGNHVNTVSGYVQASINQANDLVNSLRGFDAPSLSTFSGSDDPSSVDFDQGIDDLSSNLAISRPIFNFIPAVTDNPPNTSSSDIRPIDINDSLEAPLDNFTPQVISLPQRVTKPNLVSPNTPDISTNTATHNPPDISSVDMEPLHEIILPEVPEINFIEFEDLYPYGVPLFDADVPDAVFTYTEKDFSDDLLDKIKDILINRLDGGTGLNPIVERAIWDRGRDRESKVFLSAERALLVERSAMGFSRPTGSILAAMDELFAELQSKTIELSREIMIKQAELEQANLKDAISQSITLEDTLIKQYMAINQRLFEAAKYTRDMFFEIFKAKISQYNTQVEAYKSFIQIYTTRLQAESTKIELFKAQVQANDSLIEFDKNKISLYNLFTEFQRVKVELFKELYSAEANKLKVEELKVGIFKSQMDAYSKNIEAYSAEIQAFSEEVKAENTKLGLNETQAKIYATRIQAYAAQLEASTKKSTLQATSNELEIKKNLAELEAYVKKSQISQTNAQIQLEAFRSQNEAFNNEVAYERVKADVKSTNQKLKLEARKMAADVALANAKMLSDASIASQNSTIEALKGAGQVASNLAASAMSALNVSASFGSSVSLQAQDSHSFE